MSNVNKLFKAKKYYECLRLLDEYLQSEPNSTIWLAYQGLCYLHLELYQEAIEVLNQSLASDGTNAPALTFRGNCYFSLHQYDLAAQDFRQALLIDPDNYAVVEKLACALSRIGDMPTAIKLMQLSVAKNPNPLAYTILIDLYLEAGLCKEAEALKRKVMMECPHFAPVLKT